MNFAPPRRPLVGLELSGRRRRDRTVLVAILAVGAALTAAGYGLGKVRLRTGFGPDGLGEWHSQAHATWYIPVIAAFAMLGMAFMWRRGRFPTGVTLGISGLLALFVIATAEPSDLILEVDRVCELGYIGLVVMAGASALLIAVEPLNTLLERRALERHGANLPIVRVVR